VRKRRGEVRLTSRKRQLVSTALVYELERYGKEGEYPRFGGMAVWGGDAHFSHPRLQPVGEMNSDRGLLFFTNGMPLGDPLGLV
jgi:hypothetical protein